MQSLFPQIKEINRKSLNFLGKKENRWYLLLLIIFAMSILTQAIIRSVVYDKSDFNNFMEPTQGLFRAGLDPVICWEGNSYNTFFYSVIGLLSPFALWFSVAVWTLVSMLCYYWSIALCYILIYSKLPKFNLRLLIAPLLLLFPLVDNLQLGQSNIIMLFSVIASVYCIARNSNIKSGAWLGFAIAFKTTPALLGLLFLGNKKWKSAVTSFVVSMFLMIVVPMVFFGPNRSIRYFNTWSERVIVPFVSGGELKTKNTGYYHTNQSFDAFLNRQFTIYGCAMYPGITCKSSLGILSEEQAKLVSLIFKIMVLLVLISMFLKSYESSGYLILYQTSVLLTAMLFVSPASWLNHYIIILPSVMIAVNEIRNKVKGGKILKIALGFMILMILMSVDKKMQSLSLYFIGVFSFSVVYVIHYFRNFNREPLQESSLRNA